jgi:hypothetical protein
MIFEIRNYYYDPNSLEAYQQWGSNEDVKSIMDEHMDIVGFYVDSGEPTIFGGVDPTPSPHGTPTLTYIIRWESMEHRNRGWKELSENPKWKDAWTRHHNPNGYLHTQATFTEERK